MKCECQTELNPLQLKQSIKENGTWLFDVECLNPKCQKHNWISETFYEKLRNDYLKPYSKPINNKLPSEMNVIFCSMERHGISFIIRTLSDYHEAMFGKPISFTKGNAEISPLVATEDDSLLPLGWNNVYDVSPQDLLNKIDPNGLKYDRVVLVQRDLKDFLYAELIYWKAQKLGLDIIEKLFKKLPNEYNEMYNKTDPKDSRFIRISLDDLNNKSTVYYNKLMDFLNFPSFGRPPVLPLPTNRHWEVYSSQLRENEQLCGMLKRIDEMYCSKTPLKTESIDDLFNEMNRKIDLDTQNIVLKKVLIIGPGLYERCHFSENMYYAFKEKGYQVEILDLIYLGWGTPEGKDYQLKHKMYPISKALECNVIKEKHPDLILFDEPAYYFKNDVNIPVFYSHRDYTRNPTIYFPDLAFFWHQGVINHFKDEWGYPFWCAHVEQLITMNISIDLKMFQPLPYNKRIYEGVLCLAGRETMKNCFAVHEQKANEHLTNSLREIQEFIQLGLQWIEDPIGGLTDTRFRELLPQCESLWICFPLGQYVSRRILEAMACKVVIFVKLENKEHEEVLRQMGLEPNVHYVSIKSVKELVEINKNWNFEKYKPIIENAYEVVTKRHSFLNRVDEIAEMYKKFVLLKRVEIK
jgi:hypothetical protein